MPVRYVARADLSATVAEIEGKGEKIVSVTAEGENFWVFTTRGPGRPAGQKETR